MGVHHPHTELVVDVGTEVIVQSAGRASWINPSWEQAVAQTHGVAWRTRRSRCSPFLAASRFVPIRSAPGDGVDPLVAGILDTFSFEFATGSSVARRDRRGVSYIYFGYVFDPTSTTVSTPLDQVMAQRSGVCQDFAHLAVGAFRAVVSRPAMSAATSRPIRHPVNRRRSVPTHRMHGARCGFPNTAGSISTRRTTSSDPIVMSPSGGAATMPTSRRSAVS